MTAGIIRYSLLIFNCIKVVKELTHIAEERLNLLWEAVFAAINLRGDYYFNNICRTS